MLEVAVVAAAAVAELVRGSDASESPVERPGREVSVVAGKSELQRHILVGPSSAVAEARVLNLRPDLSGLAVRLLSSGRGSRDSIALGYPPLLPIWVAGNMGSSPTSFQWPTSEGTSRT